MSPLRKNLALLLACLFLSPCALAEIHVVQVNDDFYSPNDLTINVGDTVRWTNAAGGNSHDVVADDGSFASQAAPSFVYERIFNSVGEVLYYCSIHSGPGQNRNVFMNGRIVVQAAAPVFLINAGLNDVWFNALTAGQGFTVTVWPVIKKVFLSWFTFDIQRPPENVDAMLGEPGHRWLTAFGDYNGDTANLIIEVTSGGVFDSGVPAVNQVNDGTVTLKYTDCSNGTVEYDIPSLGLHGIIPIKRITPDIEALCQALD